MLTAAVRDLHRAHPGQFETDVRTSVDPLWENNPYITRMQEAMPDVESIDMHYPLIHESNCRPYHFIHGYEQFKGVRTHKRASRPFLTLAESSCIVIQRMPNKAFNTDGEYAAG